MPETANIRYRRLGGRRWLRWQSDDGWLAPDHLLFVRTRFFSEQYTRLYWNDIQALLLYRFAHNTGLMLVMEVLVVLAAVAVPLVQKRFEVTMSASCYVALYAAWRVTRRNWGVQVLTRTTAVGIPLTMQHNTARRMADELQREIESVQGRLSPPHETAVEPNGEAIELAAAVPQVVLIPANTQRRPILVLHGIVFALGLTSWLFARGGLLSDPYWTVIGVLLSIIFLGGLLAMFFLQQAPEFPFAVRSAAVMNASLQLSMLAAAFALNPATVTTTVSVLSPPVALLQMLACLYGLMGIYKNSLDRSDKPLAQAGTGSNSLA
jgi:hypothetical protein